MNGDVLCHYGVIGMKWGVRKDRSKSSTTSNKNKKSTKIESIKSTAKQVANKTTAKKTYIKNLSNEDLQRKVQRLQLEKQYRDLKKDEVSSGRKLLGSILNTAGKTLGIAVATYAGGKVINKALNAEVIRVGKKKK